MLFVMDSGQTGPYHGAMATAHPARSELDHIVVAARTLEEGSAWVEAALGVAPVPAGSTPRWARTTGFSRSGAGATSR